MIHLWRLVSFSERELLPVGVGVKWHEYTNYTIISASIVYELFFTSSFFVQVA